MAENHRQPLLVVLGAGLVVLSVSGLAVATASPASSQQSTTLAPTAVAPTTTATPAATGSPPTTTAQTTAGVLTTEAPSVSLSANAACDPETGQTTVTWVVNNNGGSSVEIIGDTEGVQFDSNEVPAGGSTTATEVIEGPASDQDLMNTVTVAGAGQQLAISEDIVAATCTGPEAPPDVTFTFNVTPSASRAAVGDTVTTNFCGTNTSEIELEVVRLVDDHAGVVIELPSVQTLVGPGDSICSADLGIVPSYVVAPEDAGTVLYTEAVVTVRTTESEPREFQATTRATVAVPLPAETTTTVPTTAVETTAPDSSAPSTDGATTEATSAAVAASTEPPDSSEPGTSEPGLLLAAAVTCPEPVNQTWDSSNMPSNLDLANGQVVLLASGTFGGDVNGQSGTICVNPGASFNPRNVNPVLTLNNGGSVQVGEFTVKAGGSVSNDGAISASNMTVNGSVTNSGQLTTGQLNVNAGGSLTNGGDVTVNADLNASGPITNGGHLVVGGRVQINGGGSLVNTCSVRSGSFINGASVTNNGVIDAGGSLTNNGTFTQSETALTMGGSFSNDRTVTGFGQYRFTGDTRNQGPFDGSSAQQPIVFYDESAPAGSQIFDTQNRAPTNTVRLPVTSPPEGACNVDPPGPGPTTTTTAPSTTTTTTTSTTTTTEPPTTTTSTTTTLPPTTTTSTTTTTTTTTTTEPPTTTSTSTTTTEPSTTTSTSTTTTEPPTTTSSTTTTEPSTTTSSTTTTEPPTTTSSTTTTEPPTTTSSTTTTSSSTTTTEPPTTTSSTTTTEPPTTTSSTTTTEPPTTTSSTTTTEPPTTTSSTTTTSSSTTTTEPPTTTSSTTTTSSSTTTTEPPTTTSTTTTASVDTTSPETSEPVDTTSPETTESTDTAESVDTTAPDTTSPETTELVETTTPESTEPVETTEVVDTTEPVESTTTTSTSTTTTTVAPVTSTSTSLVPTTSTGTSTTQPVPPGGPAISGSAVCAVGSGQTTLTWTLRNLGTEPLTISGDTRGVTFTPSEVPADGTATGVETIDGPAVNDEVTETVTVVVAGETVDVAATVTVPACTGPPAPDEITFTFTNDASVPSAFVGETVEYTYCGENTSDVPLEVLQVVDDRFGVLELPDVETVVQPGETICSSDLGLPVTHVATAAEEGTTIVNNAVATVRTVEAEPRQFQATDPAEVEILGLRTPEQQQPTTTALPVTGLAESGSNTVPQLVVAALALASGWLLLAIGRRRSAA